MCRWRLSRVGGHRVGDPTIIKPVLTMEWWGSGGLEGDQSLQAGLVPAIVGRIAGTSQGQTHRHVSGDGHERQELGTCWKFWTGDFIPVKRPTWFPNSIWRNSWFYRDTWVVWGGDGEREWRGPWAFLLASASTTLYLSLLYIGNSCRRIFKKISSLEAIQLNGF